MTNILDSLELSVRASNALRKRGVSTLEDFMSLSKASVMLMPNVGARTWREIREMQEYLRGRTSGDGELKAALGVVNSAIREDDLSAVVQGDGTIALFKRL